MPQTTSVHNGRVWFCFQGKTLVWLECCKWNRTTSSNLIFRRKPDPFLKLIAFQDCNINLGHSCYSHELLILGRKLWRVLCTSITRTGKKKVLGMTSDCTEQTFCRKTVLGSGGGGMWGGGTQWVLGQGKGECSRSFIPVRESSCFEI